MARHKLLTSLLTLVILLGILVGCGDTTTPLPTPTANPSATPGIASQGGIASSVDAPVDGYLAVAPRVLRAGQTETVAVSLFSRQMPANGRVQVALYKGSQQIAHATGAVRGKSDLALTIPKVAEGDYDLKVSGQGFEGTSQVRVEDGTILFVETDKPIYKPGQTIHIRVLTLDPQLKPVEGPVTVEVADAKGSKIFKKDVRTDGYGMATLDLPLSTEPNLGTWKLTAISGKKTAQADVRVERYVLPKYEITLDLAKDWVLAGDPIKGTVSAEYSYGKPVEGEVQIKAMRYVGTWEEYANVTKPLDGQLDFEIPAVQYVSGVPGKAGMGNVQLDVTVREQSTGYEEKTSTLLSVAATPVTLRLIPESVTFKPGLPLNLIVVAETPDKQPVDADVKLNVTYTKNDFKTTQESVNAPVKGGKATVKLNPPADAISASISARSDDARISIAMQAGYSPSGSFILVEQTTPGTLKVGDTAAFKVSSTKQARNFYYEVTARGKVVFSDYSPSPDIIFTVTPAMAPGARLLVYQILPTSEVAADYIPFGVEAVYPQKVDLAVSQPEVRPGDPVKVDVTTEGQAKVGLAAVDRSVFILAENRLNLQQVFDELEKLYQKPQVELHEARPLDTVVSRGAKDVFADAGVVVMSNKQVPAGKEYANPRRGKLEMDFGAVPAGAAPPELQKAAAPMPAADTPTAMEDGAARGGLAEVQRVRQFFPETWIWTDLVTDATGHASQTFDAPDSITTWMLRAVALSKETGLGISEAQVKVLQPFFVQIDLPYSAIRGEQFPVKVALYNYQTSAEDFTVDIEQSDWFQLVDEPSATVRVEGNGVGGASFTIRPTKLGTNKVKITARSQTTADAIIKDLIIEPEGVAREQVENVILSAGSSQQIDTSVPDGIIEGSDRVFLSVTGNYLAQTLQGLEGLLQMPFGCGEQNMLMFAPDVFVTRYLKETGQMKAEIMAKAESLMITGYQRELTYRRTDGSFSTFGMSDDEGSLWLTAFVLKTFAQAQDTIYIDDNVLATAKAWITQQQKADGSFEPVGFVHHEELLGGLNGKDALTAYLAVALREAGEDAASAKAVRYLEGVLPQMDDTYSLALTAYALTLAQSPQAAAAHDKLMAKAKESDGGLYWETDQVEPLPMAQRKQVAPAPPRPDGFTPQIQPSAAIETTAYATLALIESGDRINAGRAAKWLVSKRNAFGGFGSTQDTVVGLQALTRYATIAKSDVDAAITLRSGDWQKEIKVSPENADVLQVIDVPVGGQLNVEAQGKGQVVLQAVRRYNVPTPQDEAQSVFQIDVTYSADHIEVNDLIDINVTVKFTPPEPIQAGMTVLDVAVPTGFAADEESIAALVEANAKIKRYEISGRKVIFYIEDMNPNDQIQFAFKARALYPVKAQPVTSQAYSYYRTDWRGESLGGALTVDQ